MSRTPLTWHRTVEAQTLIGLIAQSGIAPQSRPIRNALSADYAPEFNDHQFYDCLHFAKLAEMQQDALTAALNVSHDAMARGVPHDVAIADFDALVRQDLAALITSEIAVRNQAVAA